jgi:hypothetical protein
VIAVNAPYGENTMKKRPTFADPRTEYTAAEIESIRWGRHYLNVRIWLCVAALAGLFTAACFYAAR